MLSQPTYFQTPSDTTSSVQPGSRRAENATGWAALDPTGGFFRWSSVSRKSRPPLRSKAPLSPQDAPQIPCPEMRRLTRLQNPAASSLQTASSAAPTMAYHGAA